MKAALSELGLRVQVGLSLLEWRALRARPGRCPLCGPTVFLRLSRDPLGTRCIRCAAWPAHMGLARIVARILPDLASLRVYEASSAGPWVAFLQRRAGELVRSEYWDDTPPGDSREGVVCQDLEHLTFPDRCFDLCTSTEVLEHVADDMAAFRELLRVLVPGGWSIFTVPLFDRDETVVRAERAADGTIHHCLPPAYHGDRLRGEGGVLVHREYGRDLVDRLARAGFENSEIREAGDATGFGHRIRVVVARRPE